MPVSIKFTKVHLLFSDSVDIQQFESVGQFSSIFSWFFKELEKEMINWRIWFQVAFCDFSLFVSSWINMVIIHCFRSQAPVINRFCTGDSGVVMSIWAPFQPDLRIRFELLEHKVFKKNIQHIWKSWFIPNPMMKSIWLTKPIKCVLQEFSILYCVLFIDM